MLSLSSLPFELLIEIFFHIDQANLTKNCVLVSNLWKSTIEDVGFWKRYHIFWADRFGQGIQEDVFKDELPWWFFSKVDPRKNFFGKNLIRNGSTELVESEELDIQNSRVDVDGLMEPWPSYPFWRILSSAGEGWKVERPEQGFSLRLPINPKEKMEESHLSLPGCYVTSNHSCSKEQVVDLIEAGFDPAILDCPDFVFRLSVEEWYTVTGSATFEMSLTAFDEHKNQIAHFNARRGYRLHNPVNYNLWERNSIRNWTSLSGCRFLHFYHGGTADGIDFHDGDEVNERLRSIKVKMAAAKLVISYPLLKNNLPAK